MTIVNDLEARDLCYSIIKDAGGEWVNLDTLCEKVRRDRKSLSRIMDSVKKAKRTPGIESYCKRRNKKNAFGSTQPTYTIKYRYVGEQS